MPKNLKNVSQANQQPRMPSPKELYAEATAPLEKTATLEEKLHAFEMRLVLAETLDSVLRHASKDNAEHATPASKRIPIQAALIATLNFLLATGVGSKRQPKTLWRLQKALIELDESGKVPANFLSRLKQGEERVPTLSVNGRSKSPLLSLRKLRTRIVDYLSIRQPRKLNASWTKTMPLRR